MVTLRTDRLTWLGHSTVLVAVDGVRLLTDPVFRARVAVLRRTAPVEPAPADIDAVLLSHVHYDHLDLPSLRRLPRSSPIVVPRGAGRLLHRHGFPNVTELAAGEQLRLGAVTVEATAASHDARRLWSGRHGDAAGYVVAGSARVYFAGDTDVFAEMSALAPGLDVALLPVAGWGPRLPPGHLDPRRAACALQLLRPSRAVPIHWGTYRRIGLRRDATAAPQAFAAFAAELAPEVEVVVLPIGGSLSLGD